MFFVAAGGRPFQTALNEKKEAMIHERVMELLTTVQPRVFSTLTPGKIIELFKKRAFSCRRAATRCAKKAR